MHWRYFFLRSGKMRKDLNLDKIFQDQALSQRLQEYLVDLAKIVRNHILDDQFRAGVQNPSEFCKSEKGWTRIKTISLPSMAGLQTGDLISGDKKERGC